MKYMSKGIICVLMSVSTVFAAGDAPIRFVRDAVLLQPSGNELIVRENLALKNDGTATNVPGFFRFYVPGTAAQSLRVTSKSPDGAPFHQTPVRTGEPGIYRINLSIQPGDSQLNLSYTLPFRNPGEFSGRVLQTDVPVRLVVPDGVTLHGDGLEFLGQEPRTKALNYAVNTAEYRATIQIATSPTAPMSVSDESGPAPSHILPRIYGNVYSILGLAFAVLGLGFVRLYRMSAAPAVTLKAVQPVLLGGKAQTPRKGKVRYARNAA